MKGYKLWYVGYIENGCVTSDGISSTDEVHLTSDMKVTQASMKE